jgi:uncharacterized membrane protein YfcA
LTRRLALEFTESYALRIVVKLSGFVGAIIGFAISVVFTEVIFANNQEWPIAINAALTAAGALAGASLARRLLARRAARSAAHQSL